MDENIILFEIYFNVHFLLLFLLQFPSDLKSTILGCILVNSGDLLEIISAGRFPATNHRVPLPQVVIFPATNHKVPLPQVVIFLLEGFQQLTTEYLYPR